MREADGTYDTILIHKGVKHGDRLSRVVYVIGVTNLSKELNVVVPYVHLP